MRIRTIHVYVFGIALYCGSPAPVFAQCGSGYVALTYFIDRPEVAAVFSGTVIDLKRLDDVLLVTFDVTRVWKGEVGSRVVVCRAARPAEPRRPGLVGPTSLRPFEMGEGYVVVAHALSVTAQAELGIEPAATGRLGTDFCGGGSTPFHVAAGQFDELGPGRPPE